MVSLSFFSYFSLIFLSGRTVYSSVIFEAYLYHRYFCVREKMKSLQSGSLLIDRLWMIPSPDLFFFFFYE